MKVYVAIETLDTYESVFERDDANVRVIGVFGSIDSTNQFIRKRIDNIIFNAKIESANEPDFDYTPDNIGAEIHLDVGEISYNTEGTYIWKVREFELQES